MCVGGCRAAGDGEIPGPYGVAVLAGSGRWHRQSGPVRRSGVGGFRQAAQAVRVGDWGGHGMDVNGCYLTRHPLTFGEFWLIFGDIEVIFLVHFSVILSLDNSFMIAIELQGCGQIICCIRGFNFELMEG